MDKEEVILIQTHWFCSLEIAFDIGNRDKTGLKTKACISD